MKVRYMEFGRSPNHGLKPNHMKRNAFVFIVASLIFVACDNPANFEGGEPSAIAKSFAPEAEHLITEVETDDRKIIREGVMHFETSDLKHSRRILDSICSATGGYVAEEKATHSEWEVSESLTLRIPAKDFDRVIGLLEQRALAITVKDIKTKDVTEEFIDINARLKTKRELEQRYP